MSLFNKLKNMHWSKNFILFALASFISGTGNALIPIAFSVESLNVSPSGVGIAVVMLALWFGRFLGMFAYRNLKMTALKPILVISDFARLAAQLGLLVYIIFFDTTIIAMAISAFIYGAASSFFIPASYQLIPKITAKENREQANSVLAILGDIYSIMGPLIGVSIVLFFGFKVVLIIDVITFALAIALIVLIQVDPIKPTSEPNTETENEELISTPALPTWSINGLKSWFFVSICIGFMGVAAPALVISNHSEQSWAIIATFLAIGSLLGSTSLLSGKWLHLSWSKMHLLCIVFISLQLVAVSSNISIIVISISAILGAAFTTISGIKWDTFSQNNLTEHQLSHFASTDQMVINTAIPLGMVLFGVSSYFSITQYLIVAIVLSVLLSSLFIRTSYNGNEDLVHDE